MTSSEKDNSGSTTQATESASEDDQVNVAAGKSHEEPAAILRDVIVERVERLAEGYRDSGQIDASALDEASRLESLLQAYRRVKPRPRRWPWRVPALAVATAGLVSVLLFVRVPCTEITLELALSSLSFQLAEAQGNRTAGRKASLAGPEIPASRAVLKGVDGISGVPGISVIVPDTWQAFASPGGLLAGPIVVDSRTWVRLLPAEAPGALKMRLKHDTSPVAIDLNLPAGVRVVPPRSELAEHLEALGTPVELNLAADPGQLLEIEFAPMPQAGLDPMALFGDELPVTGLDFKRGDPTAERRQREFSALQGGSLYLEALGGEERQVRKGEYLYLGGSKNLTGAGDQGAWAAISGWLAPYFAACRKLNSTTGDLALAGTITQISATPEHLSLQASAAVRGLRVGSRSNPQDLMPRVLEWLHAHHETKLFWGVFSFLFLFVLLPVMRFWGMDR